MKHLRSAVIASFGITLVASVLAADPSLIGAPAVLASVTTPPSDAATTVARASVPTPWEQFLTLLRQSDPQNTALQSAVADLIRKDSDRKPTGDSSAPSMMIISYRTAPEGGVRDVVVQLYHDPHRGQSSVLNPQGTVRSRLGDDLFSSADNLLGLMYYRVSYLGQQNQIQRQQRAMEATLGGDLTLLREQTIEPLRVAVIMPNAGQFLPGSLKTRVQGVVVNAELTFGEWRGKVGLITKDENSAEAVGNIVAAWRDMAVSLADTFATTAVAQPLRTALESSSVQVADNRVLASATIPAATVVRVSTELAGHGGGCSAGGVCDKSKVAVCHKPVGQPNQTICVAPSAVASHLAHGDYCGPCVGQ